MMRIKRPLCFIDLETTGSDKAKDRIVEITIAKLTPDGLVEPRTRRINPQMPIPPAATEVHGISDDDVKDCPTFKQIAESLLDFIRDCDIAGYNSNSFDIPLLYHEFHRSGITWDYAGTHFVDVCAIYKRQESRTLTAAVKFYCFRDHEEAHGSEADVMATMDVFMEQLAKYKDAIPYSIEELAHYSNYDKKRADIDGKFTIDDDGDYILTFGQHKGKKAKTEPNYLAWMMGADFLPDTKAICKSILYPAFSNH